MTSRRGGACGCRHGSGVNLEMFVTVRFYVGTCKKKFNLYVRYKRKSRPFLERLVLKKDEDEKRTSWPSPLTKGLSVPHTDII